MTGYAMTAWGAYVALLIGVRLVRPAFARFAAIVLLFPIAVGVALREELGWLRWAVPYFQAMSGIHVALLLRNTRMRPLWFRCLVNWPAAWFVSATFLATPWAIALWWTGSSWGVSIPFALAAWGLLQSLWTSEQVVDLRLGHASLPRLQRLPTSPPGSPTEGRPVSLVQITDPHLGPFMSVERLRRICERAIERSPDLIVLTGDLMTMESQRVDVVQRALEPLARYRGRVFACHGNHDHEALDVVCTVYERLGIMLLDDELARVETPSGPVEILGFDHVFVQRSLRLTAVCKQHPRHENVFRVALLHDPGAFVHLTDGIADLVLSGHTHGGQIGLVSFGLPHTLVSALTRIPDHGFWAHRSNRLYVHRAQGHYGFPLRLGVPAEQSLLRVWRSDDGRPVDPTADRGHA